MDKALFRLLMILTICFSLTCLLFPNLYVNSSRSFNHLMVRSWLFAANRFSSEAQPTDLNNKSTVAIIFDDGWVSVYNCAYPIMQRYKMVGNVAVIGNRIDRPGYMSLSNLCEVYLDGWGILNHSFQHIQNQTLTEADFIGEFDRCKKKLRSFGFRRGENIVILPGGEYQKAHLKPLFDAGYVSVRSLNECFIQDEQPESSVVVMNVYSGRTVSDVKQAILQAAEEKGALILIFHRIKNTPGKAGMNYSQESFVEICEALSSRPSELAVVSYSQLIEHLKGKKYESF